MTSIGELLWDVFETEERLGGSSANVAYHAARRGAEARLMSRVGRDERGRRALALLHGAGVNLESVQVDDSAPTGMVRVHFEDGEPRFSIEEQAAWDRLDYSPEVEQTLLQSDALCLSPLAGRTPLASGNMQACLGRLSEQPECPLILVDLNLRPPHTTLQVAWPLLKNAHFVKLNEPELEVVEAEVGQGQGVRTLLGEFPLAAVLLTRGAAGASMFGRDASFHQGVTDATRSTLRGMVGDPVGAGDSFMAVFAHEVAGSSLSGFWQKAERTLARAVHYSALVAHSRGAMPGLVEEPSAPLKAAWARPHE